MRIKSGGFTLVEVLITTAVLVIFFMAAAIIVQTGMQALGSARLKSEATRIAQEKLELIRNLPYEEVGTVGGIPAGTLTPVEVIKLHETEFTVTTTVLYVDDPYDELAPSDFIPGDYKRARISVSWSGLFSSKVPIKLMTDVSSQGVETEEDEGMLSILVFDADGQPLSSAQVTIQANAVSPAIDMEVLTDSNGKILIPGTPVCDSCYRISVTKEGYTSDRTYAFSEIANPFKPDLTVLRGQISEVSFAIDKPTVLTIRATRNQAANYFPFVGAQFNLRGTKEIGKTSLGESVYKVNRTITTSTGGLVNISDLEWDQYYLEIPPSSTIDMAGSWPFLPINLLPESTQQVNVVVQAASQHSLLVQVVDEAKQPISNMTAMISNGGVIATKSAGLANQGDWSQSYFSSLSEAIYDLTITAPGYATVSAAIAVNGDVEEFFILSYE